MKRNQIKFILGCMVAFVLAACGNDHEYSVKENQAYIAQTNTNSNVSTKITLGNEAVLTSLNVRLSSPTSEACSFEVITDESVLEEFNKLNETSYNALPSEFYAFSSNTINIDENSSLSSPVDISINPLTDELKNSGLKYAIPIRLVSKDGKKEVLASGSKYIIILDQVIIQPVPVFNRYFNAVTCIWADSRYPFSFSDFTMEFNVNMSVLGTRVGQYNNQAIVSIGVNPGTEIYARFGDAPIEGNRFQVKTQGTQMNTNTLFNANTWYHIAIVVAGTKFYFYVNGVLDNSMDLAGTGYTVSSPTWGMLNTTYLQGNAMLSEFRFWTKARTQLEIANNMYSCDPNSDGLECYFKMNEGSGNTFTDATGHGHTATANGTLTWVPDVRIDGK